MFSFHRWLIKDSRQLVKQHRYFQSTAGGRSGDRGTRAPLPVATAREHAQERVTTPYPLTEEMIARARNKKQAPV